MIKTYLSTYTDCENCQGTGEKDITILRGDIEVDIPVECSECDGTGIEPTG